MTLYGDFFADNHRRMHKWYQYFPAYETHFERFRNRHVTVFEIGVGEGGSLQQWRNYLGPFAIIVGLDVYPRCQQVEEDQIHVRIGSQTDRDFLAAVVAEFGPPDIVIDDGSHLQRHVNITFDYLYPQVAKNGVYLVEDLHAAYWPNHGGGLHSRNSFLETAKSYVDLMHADYIGPDAVRTPAGDRTTSIHFYDSVVVFEVGERRVMGHRETGDARLFSNDWIAPGHTRESFEEVVRDAIGTLEVPSTDFTVMPAGHQESVAGGVFEDSRVRLLQAEIATLRSSTSWRVTFPLRALGNVLKRKTVAKE